jgi:hypothetical protein
MTTLAEVISSPTGEERHGEQRQASTPSSTFCTIDASETGVKGFR